MGSFASILVFWTFLYAQHPDCSFLEVCSAAVLTKIVAQYTIKVIRFAFCFLRRTIKTFLRVAYRCLYQTIKALLRILRYSFLIRLQVGEVILGALLLTATTGEFLNIRLFDLVAVINLFRILSAAFRFLVGLPKPATFHTNPQPASMSEQQVQEQEQEHEEFTLNACDARVRNKNYPDGFRQRQDSRMRTFRRAVARIRSYV